MIDPHSASDSKFDPSGSSSRFRLPAWVKSGLLALIVVLATVGYFVSHILQKPTENALNTPDSDEVVAARENLPDFSLTSEDKKSISFQSFRGQVAILSFWASWCGPCMAEIPTFVELEKKYHDQGLRIVPVNVDHDPDGLLEARDFWKKKAIPFVTYFDATQKLEAQFQVDLLPTNFVVDRKGRVAFKSFGSNDWNGKETTILLEQILAEK